jgi:hypothetical protein
MRTLRAGQARPFEDVLAELDKKQMESGTAKMGRSSYGIRPEGPGELRTTSSSSCWL